MNLNPIALLNKLVKRGSGPLVTKVVSATINQPLMVHPSMGEQIIGAYLHGGIDARPPTMIIGEIAPATTDAAGVVTQARQVAVLNVSGGLANRYEGDFCDPGPLSYESLRSAFDTAAGDPNIEAIVLRIESPGGMASGLFDLADHIHANRASKPVYAAIDDYAYSAAYGLAAACSEIWITRTGGAGSVGVIAYHQDQSGFDTKIGVKITPVFSGAHKNDMSRHAPLDSGTHAWLQARMDSMRNLFAESVAKYRGMTTEAVLATEAQVYQGADAVAIGFADRIGTYADLMAEIAGGNSAPMRLKKGDRVEVKDPHDPSHKTGTVDIVSAETPYGVIIDGMEDMGVHKWYVDSELSLAEPDADDEESSAKKKKQPMKMNRPSYDSSGPPLDDEEIVPAAALVVDVGALMKDATTEATAATDPVAALAAAITAAKLPAPIADALTKRGPIAEQAPDQAVAHAQLVRSTCAAAGLELLAPEFIGADTPIEQVRSKISALRLADDPEISTARPQKAAAGASAVKASDIYARRRAATANNQRTAQ